MTLLIEGRNPRLAHTAFPSDEGEVHARTVERGGGKSSEMGQALVHARACAIFCARSTGFCCPPIAAFETQFPAQASIGVDNEAEAHNGRWRLSLK